MQFSELKIGDRLTRPDWPKLVAIVTEKNPELVELAIGPRGTASYYPLEFEQQAFELVPVPVKTNANPFR